MEEQNCWIPVLYTQRTRKKKIGWFAPLINISCGVGQAVDMYKIPGCRQGEEAQVARMDINGSGGFLRSRMRMRPPHSEPRWALAQRSPREHFHELCQALPGAPLCVSAFVAHR